MKPVQLIQSIPAPGDPGAFGAVRKHDIHTGIDLYCDNGTMVLAVEGGKVVAIEDFTGPKAGSPWWNTTQSILIEGESGVICYGEIEVWDFTPPWIDFFDNSIILSGPLKVGDIVKTGTPLGRVTQVLKKDKGVTPTSMLHFELYKHGTAHSIWWHHGEPKPEELLDPTELIKRLYNEQ